MAAEGTYFQDPLFRNTLGRLRGRTPPVLELETEIDVLTTLAGTADLRPPAAVVVHFSRCGSTLLMNALRKALDVTCLAEPQPFDGALELIASRSGAESARGRRVMECLASRYAAHCRAGKSNAIVVKFGSRGMFRMRALRLVWPNVLCIVMIRNPAEVVHSNLTKPPRWITHAFKNPISFGLPSPPPDVYDAGIEAFIAWYLGLSATEALASFDSNCRVVDYEDLTVATISQIVDMCGLQTSSSF